MHPSDAALGVDLVFFDGSLSHDLAFSIGSLSADALVQRALDHAPCGGLVCAATDGETFGHHHRHAERALAWALPVAAPAAGLAVTTVAAHLAANRPAWQAEVHVSAWSCPHGVGRWSADCGCTTGGPGGTSGRWRAPLRAALDVVRDAGRAVFARRAPNVLVDPAAALDRYVEVLVGATTVEAFVADHVRRTTDPACVVEAMTLLEQQRHAQLMYTSCAWFFWDVSGLESVQVLRYAARAMDLLVELGEEVPLQEVLAVLERAESNVAAEGTAADVWRRHVEPARVPAAGVAGEVATRLAGARTPVAGSIVAAHRLVAATGAVASERWVGTLTLEHRRTLRRTHHRIHAESEIG